jgi:hypothetical protein
MTDTSERTEPTAAPVSNTDSVSTAAPVSNAAAAPNDPAAQPASESSAAPEHDAHEGGEGADDAESGDEETSSGDIAAQAGEGGPSTPGKRKRRRRKKRKDGSVAGTQGAPTDGGEGPRPESRKKESHAPFAHLFAAGQGAKRHAFSVGEVVAGRVQRVEHGVIVVDLFGKALAIVDEYEPREIPVLPEPPEPTAAEADAEASAPGDGSEPQVAAEQTSSETATLVGGTEAPTANVAAPAAHEASSTTLEG